MVTARQPTGLGVDKKRAHQTTIAIPPRSITIVSSSQQRPPPPANSIVPMSLGPSSVGPSASRLCRSETPPVVNLIDEMRDESDEDEHGYYTTRVCLSLRIISALGCPLVVSNIQKETKFYMHLHDLRSKRRKFSDADKEMIRSVTVTQM